MLSFIKDVDKMSQAELRAELRATRAIIDDIYGAAKDGAKAETGKGKQIIINLIARHCYRNMPK